MKRDLIKIICFSTCLWISFHRCYNILKIEQLTMFYFLKTSNSHTTISCSASFICWYICSVYSYYSNSKSYIVENIVYITLVICTAWLPWSLLFICILFLLLKKLFSKLVKNHATRALLLVNCWRYTVARVITNNNKKERKVNRKFSAAQLCTELHITGN